MRGIFWLDAEEPLDPQGLRSMEIVFVGLLFFRYSYITVNASLPITQSRITKDY